MQELLINILAIVCTYVWTRYGVSGGNYAESQFFKGYHDTTRGVGSIMGGPSQVKSEEDSAMFTASLNRIAAMMQTVVGPLGAADFLDQKGFKETEDIFSRMGPYVCTLPHSMPTSADDVAPILGGIVGGLIGHFIGEGKFGQGSLGAFEKDVLSGLGTIAGAFGGMSGYEVHRGPYGSPNASHVVAQIPQFITEMGDMKSMLEGSFQPLTEKKYDNLRRLVEEELKRSLNKMSSFLSRSSEVFHSHGQESRSTEFDTRFQGVGPNLAEAAKSVAAMAGVYGGFLGYVLPRPKDNENTPPDEKHLQTVKDSLAKTRKLSQPKFGMGVFSGLLDQLLGTAAEVGGYTGIIGGMMGEVFANGAPSQAGKILFDWSVPKPDIEENNEDEQSKNQQPIVDVKELMTLIRDAIPKDKTSYLKDQHEKCFEHIAMGLKHLSWMHQFDEQMPGSLDYSPPYGTKAEKSDAHSLQRRLIARQWGGRWNKPLQSLKLINGRTPNDFSSVVDTHFHDCGALIDFINKQDGQSAKLSFFQGETPYNDLSLENRMDISIDLLSILKVSIIQGISSDNLADIFTFKSVQLNPERLKLFLKSVTDDQMTAVVNTIQQNQQWEISRDPARIISLDLSNRFAMDVYTSMLCPFANGITWEILKKIPSETLFMDTEICP